MSSTAKRWSSGFLQGGGDSASVSAYSFAAALPASRLSCMQLAAEAPPAAHLGNLTGSGDSSWLNRLGSSIAWAGGCRVWRRGGEELLCGAVALGCGWAGRWCTTAVRLKSSLRQGTGGGAPAPMPWRICPCVSRTLAPPRRLSKILCNAIASPVVLGPGSERHTARAPCVVPYRWVATMGWLQCADNVCLEDGAPN
jgi:hypothetical protein